LAIDRSTPLPAIASSDGILVSRQYGFNARTKLVRVGTGTLGLSHRPRRKDVTRLLERAKEIGEAVRDARLTWIWCPLANGQPPDAEVTARIQPLLAELARVVADGAAILVHCSAGIHRTGMFGYALLRQLGLDRSTARSKLMELREVTGEGVGEDRLAWGDALFQS
jgi:protein-tyrosine phosphatase